MKAMILAAGRGERMRPLTDTCPKPLLAAGGKPLIVWHIERLTRAGITDIVVNHAHLGALIESALGDGHSLGARIRYSREREALETAGGIRQALPLLGNAPFLVVNGDIYCDADLAAVCNAADAGLAAGDLAWLLLVPNPPHNPQGDFALTGGRVDDGGAPRHTFAGIGVYAPALFAGLPQGHAARLAPLLRRAMADRRVGGRVHRGYWLDVGTPQRLAELDAHLRRGAGAGNA